jgi:hypothetical protein
MERAIAIVSPQWASLVKHKHTTDPMNMEAINSIDIKVGNKVIGLINVNLIPPSATLGKTTMHSCVISIQHRAAAEP